MRKKHIIRVLFTHSVLCLSLSEPFCVQKVVTLPFTQHRNDKNGDDGATRMLAPPYK